MVVRLNLRKENSVLSRLVTGIFFYVLFSKELVLKKSSHAKPIKCPNLVLRAWRYDFRSDDVVSEEELNFLISTNYFQQPHDETNLGKVKELNNLLRYQTDEDF